MLEVVIDGDLGFSAGVAKRGFEGYHGLLWRPAHAAEIGGGEVTGFSTKLLQGFEAEKTAANYAVEGGEDSGTAARLGVRDEVPL